MQAGRREHFEHEHALQQNRLALAGLPVRERGVAGLTVDQLIERVAEHRVVGAQEGEVLAGQRGFPIESNGQPFLRQIRECLAVTLAAVKVIRAQRKVRNIETKMINAGTYGDRITLTQRRFQGLTESRWEQQCPPWLSMLYYIAVLYLESRQTQAQFSSQAPPYPAFRKAS